MHCPHCNPERGDSGMESKIERRLPNVVSRKKNSKTWREITKWGVLSWGKYWLNELAF